MKPTDIPIRLTVNGRPYEGSVHPGLTLLRFIRETLALTGTKEGCGIGECGACVVILDGRPVNACLVLAAEADGCELRTIEGEAREGTLSPLQQAFVDQHAVQCGFCTPGMLMSARALLDREPDPSDEAIRTAMGGNICRCTGYASILGAVKTAAAHSRGGDR